MFRIPLYVLPVLVWSGPLGASSLENCIGQVEFFLALCIGNKFEDCLDPCTQVAQTVKQTPDTLQLTLHASIWHAPTMFVVAIQCAVAPPHLDRSLDELVWPATTHPKIINNSEVYRPYSVTSMMPFPSLFQQSNVLPVSFPSWIITPRQNWFSVDSPKKYV